MTWTCSCCGAQGEIEPPLPGKWVICSICEYKQVSPWLLAIKQEHEA